MMIREVKRAVKAYGSARSLAKALGISMGAFYVWKRVPSRHVLKMSELTGIPPHKIRPDLYPLGTIIPTKS